jgi:hypothetical protein
MRLLRRTGGRRLLNETIKTKDAKHLMFTKSLMDGSINTELIRAWQAEDKVLMALLDSGGSPWTMAS